MENQPEEPPTTTTTNLQVSADAQDNNLDMEARPWPLLDEEDVVVMTEESYTVFMDDSIYKCVVLLFYDSKCPTCRKLAPEYAAAAKMMKGEVVFGMVDAYESARGFFIRRYPTMCVIFADGRLSYFYFKEMESTSDGIIKWVKRMLTVGIYSITKMEDAKRILNAETHLILGYVNDLEGPDSRELAAVSQPQSDINFYQTSRADVAEFFHIDPQVKRPALISLERVSLKYAIYYGPFTRVPMVNFVSKTKLLLLVTFVIETAQHDMHFEHIPTKQVWLLAPPEGSDEIISTFNKVIDALRDSTPAPRKVDPSFLFMKMNFKDAGRITSDELEISEPVPIIIGYTGEADGEKYILNGELTFDSIKAFAENFIELEDKVSSESVNAVSETLVRLPSRFLSNFPSLFVFPHAPQGWQLPL